MLDIEVGDQTITLFPECLLKPSENEDACLAFENVTSSSMIKIKSIQKLRAFMNSPNSEWHAAFATSERNEERFQSASLAGKIVRMRVTTLWKCV